MTIAQEIQPSAFFFIPLASFFMKNNVTFYGLTWDWATHETFISQGRHSQFFDEFFLTNILTNFFDNFFDEILFDEFFDEFFLTIFFGKIFIDL